MSIVVPGWEMGAKDDLSIPQKYEAMVVPVWV
jgi:hypothetical protein